MIILSIISVLILIIIAILIVKYIRKHKNKKNNKKINKENKENEMIWQFMKRPAEEGWGNVEKPAIVSADEKPYIDFMKAFTDLGTPIILKDFVTWTNSESGSFIAYKDMNSQNYKKMYFKKDKETGKYKLYFDKEYTRLIVLCDYVTGGMLEGFISIKYYV